MSIRFPVSAMVLLASVAGLQAQSTQHPGYQLVDIPLPDYNLGITGMDFLPNGDMVITTFRGDTSKAVGGVAFGRNTYGQAYILHGIKGEPRNVTYTKIAEGFIDAMGVKVVDGKIYIGEINRIVRLADADGDGFYETQETLVPLPPDDSPLAYSYGPLYKDGYLYMALGSLMGARNRNTLGRVAIGGGAWEVVATGLRNPNGIGLGPDNEIFVTDNQGNWRPTPNFMHVQPGKYYGFSGFGGGGGTQPATPPSIMLPYQTFNSSPTQPLYLSSGRFAGQFLYGDWARSNLYRAFIESVNGAYQGAVFLFTGGFKASVNRMIQDENGVIYVGQIRNLGHGPNGPQKLVPRPEVAVFEMLAVRSRQGGLEIEFTQPVGQMADQAAMYTLRHWYYTPTSAYYNDPVGEAPLTVSSVQVSPDRSKVYLQIAGMTAERVIHLNLAGGLQSASGQSVRTRDAYYTLNSISTSQPFSTTAIPRAQKNVSGLSVKWIAGAFQVQWGHTGYAVLTVQNLNGAIIQSFDVSGLDRFQLPENLGHQGLAIVKLQGKIVRLQGKSVAEAAMVVNLVR